jgi:hypothetical protein
MGISNGRKPGSQLVSRVWLTPRMRRGLLAVIRYESSSSRWSHHGYTSQAKASTSARDSARRTFLPAARRRPALTYSATVHRWQARMRAASTCPTPSTGRLDSTEEDRRSAPCREGCAVSVGRPTLSHACARPPGPVHRGRGGCDGAWLSVSRPSASPRPISRRSTATIAVLPVRRPSPDRSQGRDIRAHPQTAWPRPHSENRRRSSRHRLDG